MQRAQKPMFYVIYLLAMLACRSKSTPFPDKTRAKWMNSSPVSLISHGSTSSLLMQPSRRLFFSWPLVTVAVERIASIEREKCIFLLFASCSVTKTGRWWRSGEWQKLWSSKVESHLSPLDLTWLSWIVWSPSSFSPQSGAISALAPNNKSNLISESVCVITICMNIIWPLSLSSPCRTQLLPLIDSLS